MNMKHPMTLLLALSLFACKDGSSTNDTSEPADTQLENSAPVIDSVSLSPELALTADAIVATVSANDVDGDKLTYAYAWYVNGEAAGSDTDTLSADLSAKGESVTVTVTVNDGTESVEADSDALVITNTLPVLDSVRIGPAGATSRDDLNCNLPTPPSDADDDTLTGSIVWKQNGVEVSALGPDQVYAGDTILASQTEGDDVWSCEVTVSDGEATVSQSAEITLPPSLEVLVLWDDVGLGTPGLVQALEDAGLSVTLSDTDENSFDGSNPSLANFDSVVHLNGTTYGSSMVESGQQALVDFVNAGGGYIHTEWNAYEVNTGSTATLAGIQALQRDSGTEEAGHDYAVTTAHPVVANVPSAFTVAGYCGGNVGTVTNGATAVATSSQLGDAVAVNEIGNGRVVGFAHAANYSSDSRDPADYCLTDPNLLQLMVDGVYWTLE
ncbi:MAG: hypothetical protein ACI9VR_005088 [Cognaticolwellia sp.]|jgi:hypothetical protein